MNKRLEKKPLFYAVSGVKNSGKTTLITKLLPVLIGRGLKVATIKHDGHDFQTDVPGTDTFAHFQAGAYGTVVFSDHKFMVVKKQPEEARAEQMTPEQLASWFPEADLILLEGFKDSGYSKVELIRGANSSVTDLAPGAVKGLPEGVPVFGLEDVENIAEFILKDLFPLSGNTKEII